MIISIFFSNDITRNKLLFFFKFPTVKKNNESYSLDNSLVQDLGANS